MSLFGDAQRLSIGAVGVRLCLSARPRMPLEFWKLKLPSFARESGQPLTAAWLCFMPKYGCQAPIAANARVVGIPFVRVWQVKACVH